MMRLTKSMHVDAASEDVVAVVLDASVNPPGMTKWTMRQVEARYGTEEVSAA